MTSSGTRVLAGVDEAGLGPLLGPLTIGYSAFRVPMGTSDLWEAMAGAVSREVDVDAERVVVADSKHVFTRNARGERRLETTALAFLALLGEGRRPPAAGVDLLDGPLAPRAELLARHPWYAHLPRRLPQWVDAGALELRAELLRRALAKACLELLDAGVRVVPAGELNHSYEHTGNKATTVWEKSAEILQHLWKRFGRDGLWVVVDRHGGRVHYAGPLMRSFPRAEVSQLRVEPGRSDYELRESATGRAMRIRFAERAEQRSFPVALASCLAKYTRETCMRAFNAYFAELQPDLRPTAGYTTDGRRWVRDATPALERAAVPEDVLLRRR